MRLVRYGGEREITVGSARTPTRAVPPALSFTRCDLSRRAPSAGPSSSALRSPAFSLSLSLSVSFTLKLYITKSGSYPGLVEADAVAASATAACRAAAWAAAAWACAADRAG